MASNHEEAIKRADREGNAAKTAQAYLDYVKNMTDHGQQNSIKTLREIVGHS